MAQCEKCFMDPCLCHIGGFGPDEEDTTEKDIKEIIGKRCIVKTSWEGDKLFSQVINGFKISDRATDVMGKIEKFRAVLDTTEKPELIELESDEDGSTAKLVFFIQYEEPGPDGIPGHWYLDDEVIYL